MSVSNKTSFPVTKITRHILLLVGIVSLILKMLLVPAYRSTDFEVHRNWLAITYSLPLKDWYFSEISIWTLDYPPFFAYFEWTLAQVAAFVDKDMLVVSNLNYSSEATVMFMRMSVIVTDLILVISTFLFVTHHERSLEEEDVRTRSPTTTIVRFSLMVFNAGLLIVDHIHFQYNGILMGILVFCVYCAKRDWNILLSLSFSILVLMKHLFAPLAPVFAIFLFRNYCCCCIHNNNNNNNNNNKGRRSSVFLMIVWIVIRLLQLVFVTFVCLCFAFIPFLLQSNEQLPQIVKRLFPFGRGLVHAYWAPNVWSLYCLFDKIISIVFPSLMVMRSGSSVASTSGLVGDFHFSSLPSVSPVVCLSLVSLSLLPIIWILLFRRQRKVSVEVLIHALVFASLSSFMFGYHVHEKAILVPFVLQTLCFHRNEKNALLFHLIAIVGIFSLMPLLIDRKELVLKVCLFGSYVTASHWICIEESHHFLGFSSCNNPIHKKIVSVVTFLTIMILLFSEVIHPLLFQSYLPFLPLLITSCVSAILLLLCWGLSFHILMEAR